MSTVLIVLGAWTAISFAAGVIAGKYVAWRGREGLCGKPGCKYCYPFERRQQAIPDYVQIITPGDNK